MKARRAALTAALCALGLATSGPEATTLLEAWSAEQAPARRRKPGKQRQRPKGGSREAELDDHKGPLRIGRRAEQMNFAPPAEEGRKNERGEQRKDEDVEEGKADCAES